MTEHVTEYGRGASRKVEGIVFKEYGRDDCVCHVGTHVFSSYMEARPGTVSSRYINGKDHFDPQLWVFDFLSDCQEGQKVRITIEVEDQ